MKLIGDSKKDEAAEKLNLVHVKLIWQKKKKRNFKQNFEEYNDEYILHCISSYTFQNFRRGCILDSFYSEATMVTNYLRCMSFLLLYNNYCKFSSL